MSPQAANVDLSDGQSFASGFPHDFFESLRRSDEPYWHPPTAKTPDGEGFWVVSRYDHIAALLRDPKTFSSDKGGDRTAGGTALKDERSAGKMLNQTDNPHHWRLRDLVQRGFTSRAMNRLESDLRARTVAVLEDFMAADETDFVAPVARELPLQAICSILGVPQDDRGQLVQWVDAGMENTTGDVFAHEYLRKLGDYARHLIADKRENPGDDILSTIIHARLEGVEPPQLTDYELRLFFNLLFPAGAETTRSAMAGAMKAFADFPGEYERLRRDPNLIKSAVEEIVRWTTPSIYKRRTVVYDTEFQGARLRRGDKITIWEMSANRDEREFGDPFRFNVGRSPNRHLGFGAGVHFCLGSQLARTELRILLEELVSKVSSVELAGEGEWMPNNRLLGLKHLPVRLNAMST
ncbi:MAG: cytochrome P450 [Chromatiales bacterium]|nr:cytochrome P450 [Chromatiales bacterium]